jgi:hypothetical protein
MNKLIRITFLIYLGFFASISLAQEKTDKIALKLLTGFYQVSEFNNLQSILENEFEIEPKYLTNKSQLIRNLKRWNLHIVNWENLEKGSELYLEIPIELVARKKFLRFTYLSPKEFPLLTKNIMAPSNSASENIKLNLALNTKEEVLPKQYKANFSIFSTMSYGTFSENIVSPSSNAKSTQNSPFTLGSSVVKKIAENYSFSSSLYISYLVAGQVNAPNVQNTTVKIPPEIGYNMAIQRLFPFDFIASFGVDYEKFTTLNIDDISRGTTDTLQTRNQKIVFVSGGLAKLINISEKYILLRITAGQSAWGSSDSAAGKYTGRKYMFYSIYRFRPKWSTHFFSKLLDLDGPSELAILRFGVGINYHF